NLVVRAGHEREIFLEIVRADGHLQRGELVVRSGFLQRGGLRQNGGERGVLVLGAAGKFLHQIARGRRINRQQRPGDDDEDENETAQVVVLIHGKSGGGRVAGVVSDDLGDGGLGDFKFGVARTDGNRLVLDRDDGADDAGGGHDLVAGLERFEQFLLLLGALLLRTDEDEIEHHHQQHHGRKGKQRILRLAGLAIGRGRGKRQHSTETIHVHIRKTVGQFRKATAKGKIYWPDF